MPNIWAIVAYHFPIHDVQPMQTPSHHFDTPYYPPINICLFMVYTYVLHVIVDRHMYDM
jgi:hypothetical protein